MLSLIISLVRRALAARLVPAFRISAALVYFAASTTVRAQEGDPVVTTPAASITAPWVGTWGTTASSAANDSNVANIRYHGDNAFVEQTLRAHSRGIKIFAGTLLPLEGFAYETFASRAKRAAINTFLRSGVFDGVADFELAVEDPSDTYRILPSLDSGDHHHPNDEGYRLMAKTIDLAWFQ